MGVLVPADEGPVEVEPRQLVAIDSLRKEVRNGNVVTLTSTGHDGEVAGFSRRTGIVTELKESSRSYTMSVE